MAIQEMLLARALSEGLKAILKASFNTGDESAMLAKLDEELRAELSWSTNFLDELHLPDERRLDCALSLHNRARGSQTCSVDISLAAIRGALHGPLNTIYRSRGVGTVPTVAIAPNESIAVPMAESILKTRQKPVEYHDTTQSIFRDSTDAPIKLANGALASDSELSLDAPMHGEFEGVGIALRIVNQFGLLRTYRYAYGGLANYDSPDTLTALADSMDNGFFKYVDGLTPFDHMFIDDGSSETTGRWVPTNSLTCLRQENSKLVASLASAGASVTVGNVFATDSASCMKNFVNVLSVLRKRGPVSFDGKI